MAVIINDFEIVVDPPAPPTGTGAGNTAQVPSPPPLRPEDIERIVRHFEQRRTRLVAD